MRLKTILAPEGALSYGEMQEQPPPEYDENGVDLTLILWMMDMTPAERLDTLQAAVDALWPYRSGREQA
ncbi:MAG TPA: hypothetical protein VMU19_11800 [Bryobacteraceae bacterium]|nr:hypothetical protein [Bryobacteraceae bacterium]